MTRLALLPVFFLFLLPGYTYAQDILGGSDARILKDVGPMDVVIELLPSDFESFGLHEYDIQRDVELKLRRAGITIDDYELSEYLYVFVRGMCRSSGICGYSIDISYTELVIVQRGDEEIRVLTATWEPAGIIGTVGGNNLRSSVSDDVKDLVDEFINAYLTANPKQ